MFGVFQDSTLFTIHLSYADQTTTDTQDGGYHNVLKFTIGIKAVAFCSRYYLYHSGLPNIGKGMTTTKKQREQRESEIEDPARDPLTKRTIKPTVTYSDLGLLCAMIITAWVVFVRYLI